MKVYIHQLGKVEGKRRYGCEEENMKVDGSRDEGRRGGKKGIVRRGVEKRGGLEKLHHPLCGGNRLAKKNRKNSPIPIPKTLSHPPVTTIELGRHQMMKE